MKYSPIKGMEAWVKFHNTHTPNPGLMIHACNLRAEEVEPDGFLEVAV